MRVIDGDELQLLRGKLTKLEIDQLRGIDLIEPVARGDIARFIKLQGHAVAAGDESAALPGGLPHRVVDNRRVHVSWKAKLLRDRFRRRAENQTQAPPA